MPRSTASATALKPVTKSLWGYGGVVRAPDGTIWKVATSAKKDSGPATRRFDDMVLLLGVADVAASKRFYRDQGFAVAKSFGGTYVEFESGPGPVKLALYRRRALAKDAGCLSRRHRLAPDRDRRRPRPLHGPGRVRLGSGLTGARALTRPSRGPRRAATRRPRSGRTARNGPPGGR